jgi:hypothetical protein
MRPQCVSGRLTNVTRRRQDEELVGLGQVRDQRVGHAVEGDSAGQAASVYLVRAVGVRAAQTHALPKLEDAMVALYLAVLAAPSLGRR